MKVIKRLTRQPAFRRFLCRLGTLYIRLVYATSRWTTQGEDIPRAFWEAGKPFILCFWHGRLMMMPFIWRRNLPIRMLTSQHDDGQLIAELMRPFGIDTITGSSSRGGGNALRAMITTLRDGVSTGLTPDGPRGPRMRATSGTITLARLAGVPVIPVAFSTTHGTCLDSWDRFLVARPFGRGVFIWGNPLEVPRNADDRALEDARNTLESRLNDLTNRADRHCGRAPVQPDPATPDADI